MKKVLVIEFMDFHAEIFPCYPFFCSNILGVEQKKINFIYAVSPLRAKDLSWLNPKYKIHIIEPIWRRWLISKSGLRKVYYAFLTKKLLKAYQPDLVIFNTIQAPNNRFISAVKVCGQFDTIITVHNPSNSIYKLLKKSNNNYFVSLNRYNYEFAKKKHDFLDGYLTCAFPCYNDCVDEPRLSSENVIAVIGNIDFRRRDYNELINIVKFLKKRKIYNIKFILVSGTNHKHGRKLLGIINEFKLEEYFHYFVNRPSDFEFYKSIVNSDFIMPLLKEGSRYFKGVISGSIVHSGAYKKPLILRKNCLNHFQLTHGVNAIGYKDELDFYETIVNVTKEKINKNYSDYLKKELELNRNYVNNNLQFLC